MKEKTTPAESASRVCYETMEAHARGCIQRWLQELLEAEVSEFLGRAKSQRRAELEEPRVGYRNGYSKPRKVALTLHQDEFLMSERLGPGLLARGHVLDEA